MPRPAEEGGEADSLLACILESTDELIWAVESEHFALLACLTATLLRRHAKVFGICVMARDVTDERKVADALAQREAFYRKILEGSVSWRGCSVALDTTSSIQKSAGPRSIS